MVEVKGIQQVWKTPANSSFAFGVQVLFVRHGILFHHLQILTIIKIFEEYSLWIIIETHIWHVVVEISLLGSPSLFGSSNGCVGRQLFYGIPVCKVPIQLWGNLSLIFWCKVLKSVEVVVKLNFILGILLILSWLVYFFSSIWENFGVCVGIIKVFEDTIYVILGEVAQSLENIHKLSSFFSFQIRKLLISNFLGFNLERREIILVFIEFIDEWFLFTRIETLLIHELFEICKLLSLDTSLLFGIKVWGVLHNGIQIDILVEIVKELLLFSIVETELVEAQSQFYHVFRSFFSNLILKCFVRQFLCGIEVEILSQYISFVVGV